VAAGWTLGHPPAAQGPSWRALRAQRWRPGSNRSQKTRQRTSGLPSSETVVSPTSICGMKASDLASDAARSSALARSAATTGR
jgi:hypothetical protein